MNKLLKILFSLFISIILLFAFALPLNPVGNWYQQFLPNINGASIRDITFTDSLNGHCVTSIGGSNSYILKTTNSGDNWVIKFMHTQPFVRVQFINANTGFTNAFQTIFKTTNAGENWSPISLPGIFGDDMFVLNEDTIWLAMTESLTGGVFRTTNGGASWQNQINLGSQNPTNIYFYNKDLGFTAENTLHRTTNGGLNWIIVPGGTGFSDMIFFNSLTGLKTGGGTIQKTVNGGLNWVNQVLPQGGDIIFSQINEFKNINNDTIWGVGGTVFWPGYGNRGMLYRTTNSGTNWLFQIPDTNINIGRYLFINFSSKSNGWAYTSIPTGIHTTTGGDPVWYTGIQQISSNIPQDFELKQNYPNPFNPRTVIPYKIRSAGYVTITAYDMLGRESQKLVSSRHTAGEYEVDFMGKFSASGVYFYRMEVIDDRSKQVYAETKKMILIK